MIINTLITLFTRDLNRLKTEIESYKDEKNMWLVAEEISNSGGNLCLHLVGNLNAFIGAGIAKTSYVRQRDLEFSLKDVPRSELIKQIEDTIEVVTKGLRGLNESELSDDFPIVHWGEPTEMEYTLIHLFAHLSYHLGQVNYHRRLLDA